MVDTSCMLLQRYKAMLQLRPLIVQALPLVLSNIIVDYLFSLKIDLREALRPTFDPPARFVLESLPFYQEPK